VKRVGQALKEQHDAFGGFTELLAVVSPGTAAPQVLELMPQDYKPTPRAGIIGIGDGAVLNWITENFPTDPPHDAASALSPEAIASLMRVVDGPITLPAPSFTIDEAALRVTAALSEGIREAGGPTVDLPLQVMTVEAGGLIRAIGIGSTADLETWDDVTAESTDLVFPKLALSPMPRFHTHRTAVQVLD
jgi:hypothetical protein